MAAMIRTPLVMPQLMLRIHSPNRDAIAEALSIAPGARIELPSRMRFLFLCFTNRSGSAYLIDLLATAGITAQALETLNAAAVLSYSREHGVQSLQDYFEHIVRRDARNNIYIVKVAAEQLRLLTEAGILSQIGDSAEFLFMHRADKLGQAISRTIAEQNNRWGWNSPSDFPDDRLEYSAERITQHIYDIVILNHAFEEFFALNGITPISVEYERLRSQPQHELDEIAGRLRLPAATFDPAGLTSRQQANAINHSWRSRFLQATQPPPGTTPGPAPAAPPPSPVVGAIEADIVAHVRNIGDVVGTNGAWLGRPGNGSWIEGFSIMPRHGLTPNDVEYCGIHESGQMLPWVSAGAYSGTRGITAPLRGLCVRPRDATAMRFQCEYSARFQDGETVGPMQAGQPCRSSRLAPLETFQIVLRPASR
jgi:LPS sulfotransferase NodH